MRSLAPVLVLVLSPLLAAASLPAQVADLDHDELARRLRVRLGVPAVEVFELAVPLRGEPERLTLQWIRDGRPETVDLVRRAVRARGFSIGVQGPGGRIADVPAPPERTYRGQVRGSSDVEVAAGLGRGGGLKATVLDVDETAWFVRPVRDLLPDVDPRVHALYHARSFDVDGCGVLDALRRRGAAGGPPSQAATSGGYKVAEIAFDADVEFYRFMGSSVAAVVGSIERTLSAVNLMYEREVEITHRLTRIVVRTSEPDPYDGNDAGVLLRAFRDEWNNNQMSVPRDVAHFVTSRPMGNILGLAYVGVVCTSSGYGLSRFRDDDRDGNVLGHELGHNWSVGHCADPCDVMCGCGLAGGFGPINTAAIVAFRNNRTCLENLFADLFAHYRLDERSGTTAVDSGPQGRDGFYQGGTLGVPGAAPGTDTAVEFDGQGERVLIHLLGTLRRNLSVAAWVRPRGGTFQQIFSYPGSWSFGLFGLTLFFRVDAGSSYFSLVGVPPDQWSHVAAVFDSDHSVTFYLNGQRVSRVTGSGPAGGGQLNWFIGSRDGRSEFFHGRIDDVQLYDGTLSDAHVARLFQNPGQPCIPRWENYGTGTRGTVRVPSLTVTRFPLIGETFVLELESSRDGANPGVLVLGAQPTSVPLFGGTLLVDLGGAITLAQGVPQPGVSVPMAVPDDPSLLCVSLYFQSVQLDWGAPGSFAFTPGLRVVLGG